MNALMRGRTLNPKAVAEAKKWREARKRYYGECCVRAQHGFESHRYQDTTEKRKGGIMKIEPYFVTYSDSWILGPAVARDTRELRIGLGLIVCEVGICFTSERPFGFGCNGCGKIGEAPVNKLPEGWEKRYRRDHTFYFLCPECVTKPTKVRNKGGRNESL